MLIAKHPNINTNKLCQQYLNMLYRNMRGHKVNARQNKNMSEAYGEILYPSVNKLLSEISLTSQDVFFDLGSGLGKVVVQVFLTSQVKESCGIEIIPELHEKAQFVGHKIQQDLPEFYVDGRKLTFLLGSFLEVILPTASVVLIGSPCFSQKILYSLGEMINDLPSIHTVLTLRPVNNLRRLTLKKIIRIEGSWDSGLCYLYQK